MYESAGRDRLLVGGIDIENFPTLSREDRDAITVPEEIAGLPEALAQCSGAGA